MNRKAIAILLLLSSVDFVEAQEFSFRKVALTGNPTPGVDGEFFNGIYGVPVINGQGQVAFGGTFGSFQSGIWSEGSGSLGLVAREGAAAPGTNGVFGNLDPQATPYLNDAGEVTFRAALQIAGSVTNNNNIGIWGERSGTLALLARQGSFGDINFATIRSAGPTAFLGFSGSTPALPNLFVWREKDGVVSLVARSGSNAPGLSGNFVRFAPPVTNDAGHTTFTGSVIPSNMNNTGIWSNRSGTLAPVALEGSPAPGVPSATFGDLQTTSSDPVLPVINNVGQTAFAGYLTPGVGGVTLNDDRGIWSEGSGALTLVARERTQAPGTPSGAEFVFFNPPVLNSAGQTAFVAVLRSGLAGVDSNNDVGLWSEGGGSLSLVVREGDEAPGTNGALFSSFSNPVLNSAGQIAFSAELQLGIGGVTSQSMQGLWMQDLFGELHLVARAGDEFEVTPGDVRIIESVGFQGDSGNQAGCPSGFNDNGELAFYLDFEAGNGVGVYVASLVPEPTGITLTILFGASMLYGRRNISCARHKN